MLEVIQSSIRKQSNSAAIRNYVIATFFAISALVLLHVFIPGFLAICFWILVAICGCGALLALFVWSEKTFGGRALARTFKYTGIALVVSIIAVLVTWAFV